ncbi:MAG TPA: hypothetical protein PKV53_09675, partial [Anaerohalosphaeraceae bacterium]|nr:hypothetical protein [Anaerohalosphaeraceae bacterium]
MDALIVFHYDASDSVKFTCSETSLQKLPSDQLLILTTALKEILSLIKQESKTLYRMLINKRVQVRITDSAAGTASLLPHDILMNAALLTVEKRRLPHRHRMLMGILYRALYHWCNPELHITQVRMHTLRFYDAHRDILKSTIQE